MVTVLTRSLVKTDCPNLRYLSKTYLALGAFLPMPIGKFAYTAGPNADHARIRMAGPAVQAMPRAAL